MKADQRRTPFVCPVCGEPVARVTETRAGQGSIRRRRVCAKGHAIWTKEVPLSVTAA